MSYHILSLDRFY